MSFLSDDVRRVFKEGDDVRDAGLSTPEDIVRFDDIVYGDDPYWQKLDVYRPKAAEGKRLPVIVSVHGGAWVYGDKERYQYYCMDLAQRGFAAVNFTYRLAPEFKFPASLEDTNLVFSWVLKNCGKYDFDEKRIFAVGDSAGAHILALYTAACTNPSYAAGYDFSIPEGFAPAAVALNCGAYVIDLSGGEDDFTVKLMADFLPEKGSENELNMVNAVSHVTRAFPPAFIMTAEKDFLREQAPVMTAKLMENNVPFVFRFYSAPDHDISHVFHLGIRTAEARLCNDEECAFLKKFTGSSSEEA